MWALWTRANGVPVSEFFTLHLKWRACIKVIPIKIIEESVDYKNLRSLGMDLAHQAMNNKLYARL